MIINSANVVYDPLDIVFDVIEKGGSGIQKKETSTGRYDPDREITPWVLVPNLQIRDRERVLADGDYSMSLYNARWYAGSETEENRITKDTAGYELGDHGKLTVDKNATPGEAVNLLLVIQYTDPRRNEVMTFRKICAMSCEAVNETSLALDIDVPVRMPIVPMRNRTTRILTAQLRNGQTNVEDADAVYVWKVLDGTAWRKITVDDVYYCSGQDSRKLTLDLRYIDKEVIRVEAYSKSNAEMTVSAQTKAHRWYGQWEARCDIVRGKYIHPDTEETEVCVTVANRKGNIVSAEKYYDIGLYFRRDMTGEAWRQVSHSGGVTVPSQMAGTRYGVRAVFGAEVRELTALRAVTSGGKRILINGKAACMQIPGKKSEV